GFLAATAFLATAFFAAGLVFFTAAISFSFTMKVKNTTPTTTTPSARAQRQARPKAIARFHLFAPHYFSTCRPHKTFGTTRHLSSSMRGAKLTQKNPSTTILKN
ncbi:MAG: hypothetical protein WCD45_01680, partial [Gallionella sp.]